MYFMFYILFIGNTYTLYFSLVNWYLNGDAKNSDFSESSVSSDNGFRNPNLHGFGTTEGKAEGG